MKYHFNCRERYVNIVYHRKLKPEKNSCLNGIQTDDLCDTGAVLLPAESYLANLELFTFLVRNIPVDGEECK